MWLSNITPTYEYENDLYINRLLEVAAERNIKIDLNNPKTINDKINWIKLHPTPLKTYCSDKILLHEFSKHIFGKDICIPILKIYNNTKEINWNELPEQFVIKCNHGCQYNIIVKDKSINKKQIIKKLNKWLLTNFSSVAGCEMQYDKIFHRIYVEKYMGDVVDYKFWCFNGEPKFWAYSLGNDGKNTEYLNFYDFDNNLLELNNEVHPRNPNIVPIIPDNFNEMLIAAKKLCRLFDFVRVDMYSIENTVYLGELTFTPTGGWMKFGKDSEYLGNLLKLDK